MREDREGRENRWRRLKTFVGLVAVAFAVALAVVVGNRLSEEALGVLAGAVCGVGAAIPTSLIVVAVSRRQGEGGSSGRSRVREREMGPEPRHTYPPVVVISPQGDQPSPYGWRAAGRGSSGRRSLPMGPPTEREFTVVGGAPASPEGPWPCNRECF
jgi:hypothetical protein